MTFIASIAPDQSNLFAALDHADETMPGWWEASQAGERFLSERDFPIYDEDADLSRVSNEDWELFTGSRY